MCFVSLYVQWKMLWGGCNHSKMSLLLSVSRHLKRFDQIFHQYCPADILFFVPQYPLIPPPLSFYKYYPTTVNLGVHDKTQCNETRYALRRDAQFLGGVN